MRDKVAHTSCILPGDIWIALLEIVRQPSCRLTNDRELERYRALSLLISHECRSIMTSNEASDLVTSIENIDEI